MLKVTRGYLINNKLMVKKLNLYEIGWSELEQTFDRLYAPACIQNTVHVIQ